MSAVLGLPPVATAVFVDGFSATAVVCRASLRCAATAYASSRRRRLLESYVPLAACHRGRKVFRHNVRYLCA